MNRLKTLRTLMMGLMAVGALTSCATDDDITDLQQEINKLKQQIGQEGGSPMIKLTGGEAGQTELSLFPGETLAVKVETEKGITDLAASTTDTDWRVLCDEEKGELLITAPLAVRDTPAKVFVSGANAQGVMYRAGIVCRMRNYTDPKAVLILNEGQVGTGEMGSMIYVNPKGDAIAYPFHAINGTDLGVASQDMSRCGDKIYVIAQGPYKKSGTLSEIDANTLRLVRTYTSEISEAQNPTHLLAYDAEHIYIRDEHGIACYDSKMDLYVPVADSKGALKHPFLQVGGKVFFTTNDALCAIKVGEKTFDKVAKRITFPGKVSGMAKADDKHLYVSYGIEGEGVIALVNVESYEVEKSHTLPLAEGGSALQIAWASTSTITAKGDTIYFGEGKNSIFRHLFSTGATKEMWSYKTVNPEHMESYQTPAVHPVTGLVYYATLKGWGSAYKTNTVYVLDLKGDEAKLVSRIDNLVRFPAGYFFPYAEDKK